MRLRDHTSLSILGFSLTAALIAVTSLGLLSCSSRSKTADTSATTTATGAESGAQAPVVASNEPLQIANLDLYSLGAEILDKPIPAALAHVYDDSVDAAALMFQERQATGVIAPLQNGKPVGSSGLRAIDHVRGLVVLQSNFASHFCADFTAIKNFVDSRLQSPEEKPALFHYILDSAPNGSRVFIETRKLASGESQWRIAHYFGKKAADTFMLRFDPKAGLLKQIIHVPQGQTIMIETPIVHEGSAWTRDPSRQTLLRASVPSMRSEFDGIFIDNRAQVEWRWKTSANSQVVEWTKAGFYGSWGKSDQTAVPTYVPSQIAMIGGGGLASMAADFNVKQNQYITYKSNAALRTLREPESVKMKYPGLPKFLGLNDVSMFKAENAQLIPDIKIRKAMNPPDKSCAFKTKNQIAFLTSTETFKDIIKREHD